MTPRHGSPVWIDLGSNDLEKAKEFYRELFGWNYTSTGDDFGGYLMVDSGRGDAASAVGGMGPNMGMDGEAIDQPAWWTIYLGVDDIEQACAEVTAHGGMVFVPPMPIGDMGRMAIVGAPSGASFGLWETGSFGGIEFSPEPGTPVWFEAMTLDFARDAEFYAAVLGWENVPMADEDDASGSEEYPDVQDNEGGYVTNFADATAGLCEANAWLPEGMPSYWRAYFRVEDVDATVARVQELGGSLVDGPVDSPFGRLATVTDAEGAMFQVIADPVE
ncbi:MAG: VOC family protein [bacterium]|nr:VOC family protein [bacterium]